MHTYDGASRSAVRARAARAGAGLWVSEFGEGGPCGRELALAIVRDLRELAPSAWVLWQAVSPDDWGVLRFGRGGTAAETTRQVRGVRTVHALDSAGMQLVGTDDPHSVAAVGDERFSAVVVGDAEADELVRLEVGAARAGHGRGHDRQRRLRCPPAVRDGAARTRTAR